MNIIRAIIRFLFEKAIFFLKERLNPQKKLSQKIWEKFVPREVRIASIACARLLIQYNLYGSLTTHKIIDDKGSPMPWITYTCWEFLEQLDLKNKEVFEWGGGNYTLYWARQAKSVISIEDDEKWFSVIKPQLPDNAKMFLCNEFYLNQIKNYGLFDIIFVDSDDKFRVQSTIASVDHVREGGMIILDNSDMYPQAAEFLRGKGFTQIDFFGFAPQVSYVSVTSIFFKILNFPMKYQKRPVFSHARGVTWDRTELMHIPLKDFLSVSE